jgi:hypothetical protein
MGRNYRYENLTGGLNNVSTVGTINQGPNRTESPDMMNVEYYKLGGIKSMEGNTRIGDVQDSAVVAGWEYSKGNMRYMMIGLADGSVRRYDVVTDTFEEVYKFPSVSNRMSFCNMNNGVVVTNGIDDMVFYELGRNTLLAGTVKLTQGSVDVVGTNTLFETDVYVGDSIVIDNEIYFVESITDETHLKLSTAATRTASNLTFRLGELSLCNAYLTSSDDPNLKTPIRGLAIQFFNGKLWVGSGNALFYSELGHYNRWDNTLGAGVLQSIYNDTSDIKALGLYSSYMIIHKEFYSYLLVGGESEETMQISPYAAISCDSQQSWVNMETRYLVFSRENMGIYPLLQRNVFTDKYLADELSAKIRNIFLQIDINNSDRIFFVKYPKKRYMMAYFPNTYNAGSSLATIYDFQTKTWLLRLVPQDVSIVFEFDNKVYLGTRDGRVLEEFRGSTFDGEAINAYWKSPWFEFGDGSLFKSIEEFAMYTPEDITSRFYVNVYRDGESLYKQREVTGDVYDVKALIWEGLVDTGENPTVWDDWNWVKEQFFQYRFPLEKSFFRMYQIEFKITEPDQSFAIGGFGFNRVEAEEVPW